MMRGRKESLSSWKKRVAKRSRQMRKKPGHAWRVLAQSGKTEVHASSTPELRTSLRKVCKILRQDASIQIFDGPPWKGTVLDEVVIDDWLHIEQMDERYWWMRVGEYVLWITIPKKGPPQVTVRREPEDRLLTRVQRSDREIRKGKFRKLR
jgi:hypothetical protein